jgi:hypothetical protein
MKQKIKNIAKAYTNSLPVDEGWYISRLSKCVDCEFNSNKVEYNSLTAMQKVQKTTNVCSSNGFCTICSCCVDRKASVKSEVCALVKNGKDPRWDAIEVEGLTGFAVENITKNYKLGFEEGIYQIDFGKREDVVLEFSFKIITNNSKYSYSHVNTSCSCTSSNVESMEDGNKVFDMKLSTKGFPKGLTTRTASALYKDGAGREYNVPFVIRVEK